MTLTAIKGDTKKKKKTDHVSSRLEIQQIET